MYKRQVWEKALAYNRQAGEKAWARSAYREAVACYEQALVALEHLPDSRAATEQAIDLRLGLRGALTALGEAPGRLLDHLGRAEALAQALGDDLRLAQVYAHMSTNFRMLGEMERAIEAGQRALALAVTLGQASLQARMYLSLGRAYYDLGDYARAVEHLGRNVATLQGDLRYERFGSLSIVAATSRAWLSLCHAERGAFAEGLAQAEEGQRIAETANHPFSLLEACYGAGMVSLRQGDVPRAIPVLERAVGFCQDADLPVYFPWVAAALGVAYALEGRVAVGLPRVEHGVEQAVARSTPRFLALAVAWLSEAYLLAGRLEDARTRAAQAVDLARQYTQRGTQAWALWLLGESTTRQASPAVESAADHYRQAVALADKFGMRPLQAHCHCSLGTLYTKLGQPEQAHTELSMAIELYRALEMTFWLPEAEAALAEVVDVKRP